MHSTVKPVKLVKTSEPNANEESEEEQTTYEQRDYKELTCENDLSKCVAVDVRVALGANLEYYRSHVN